MRHWRRMRALAALSAAAAAAAALAALPARAAPAGGGLRLAPCQLRHPSSARAVAARCGTLEVPEDRARPGGRRVALRVAVAPAEDPAPRATPIAFLAGGPGQAASEAWPLLDAALGRLRRTRDVVLVDQRGTGGSAPLACAGRPGGTTEPEPSRDEALRRLAACGRELAEGRDLAHYRTPDLVEDLDAVRAALGHERLALVGVSYGTRAALAYARAHPDRVRALVLDGVVPFEMAVGADLDADAERALERAFGRCAADPACAAAFPDPRGDLLALLREADRAPIAVTLADWPGGRPRRVELDGDGLRQLAVLAAYAPEVVSLLPLLFRQARAGDLLPLVALGQAGGRDLAAGLSQPVLLAVLCAEDVPFHRPPAPGPILGDAKARWFRAACAAFPHAPPDAAFREPRTLAAPALLLSGEADPITPPRWGELALRHLPRGRHLVLAGMAHGNLTRGCVPRLVERFLDAGGAEGLDARCLEAVRPAPFFLDAAGPGP